MAQPTGQDQTGTAPGSQANAQGTPWDKDLAFIEDESLRSQVSDYLGRTVQPYVTQLEQRSKPAVEFFEDFQNEPGATTLGVIEELYGPDAAKTFAGYLEQEFGSGEPQEEQHAEGDQDPRLARMLDSWEQGEQEREWKEALQELQEQHQDVEIDDMLFRPFAAMTEGDLDLALEGYRNFMATAKEKLGIAPAPESEGEIAPPPALGTTGGTTPQPVQPTDQTLGEAITDWVADLKAQGQGVAPPHP